MTLATSAIVDWLYNQFESLPEFPVDDLINCNIKNPFDSKGYMKFAITTWRDYARKKALRCWRMGHIIVGINFGKVSVIENSIKTLFLGNGNRLYTLSPSPNNQDEDWRLLKNINNQLGLWLDGTMKAYRAHEFNVLGHPEDVLWGISFQSTLLCYNPLNPEKQLECLRQNRLAVAALMATLLFFNGQKQPLYILREHLEAR